MVRNRLLAFFIPAVMALFPPSRSVQVVVSVRNPSKGIHS